MTIRTQFLNRKVSHFTPRKHYVLVTNKEEDMRTTLTIVLSILAVTALAQASVLSDKEADIRWEQLMAITSGETETEKVGHLRSHGMGEDGAKALTAFAKQAQLEMEKVFAQFPAEVCGKQTELRETGGPEMLAQIIEQQRVRQSAARRRLLAQANSLLSSVDQERLEHLFTSDHAPRVVLDNGGTDTVTMVRNGQITVEQAIARMCKKEKQ
jgi:hypothetical protein